MKSTAKKKLTIAQLKAVFARDLARKRAMTVRRRARVVNLRMQGLSQRAIAKLVDCSQRHVSTLLGESAPQPPFTPSQRERIVHKETIGNLAILISSRHVYARVELSQ